MQYNSRIFFLSPAPYTTPTAGESTKSMGKSSPMYGGGGLIFSASETGEVFITSISLKKYIPHERKRTIVKFCVGH